MAALDYITIRGFKSIAAIEKLELKPINVVIGPNGSGKSNFIGAFAFLHAIRQAKLSSYVDQAGGAEKILHFGSKTTAEMFFELSFANTNRYDITLRPTADDQLLPAKESAWFNGDFTGWISRSLPRHGSEAGISNPNQSGSIASYVRNWLERWRVYHFHDTSFGSPMKKTVPIADNRYFRADASNLPAYLYLLSQRYPNEYGLIRKTVQRVAPFFDDFVLEPLRLNPENIRLEWKHVGSDAYFNANSLSDGTLRFIALSVLLLQPEYLRPSVILIDEPELGLHPYAITMLSALIKQASTRTQVIISTQSPFLLDHFEPEDVLVADRVDGGTQLTRLSTEPLQDWLADYSLGQLWEKNELGGRPTAE